VRTHAGGVRGNGIREARAKGYAHVQGRSHPLLYGLRDDVKSVWFDGYHARLYDDGEDEEWHHEPSR
jgi:hypothetical protein